MARKLTYEELEKTVRELQKEAVECKQAKEKLYEQLNMHRTILASTPDLFVLKNRDSVYRAANLAFCKFIGKKEEEIIGKTDFDLFPRAEAERYRRDDERIMETGIPQVEDEKTTGSEGRKYLQVAKTPVVDETGTCVGVLCSVRDVSERKRAEEALQKAHDELDLRVKQRTAELVKANERLKQEMEERKRAKEALRESEERYHTIFELAPDSIVLIDGETGELAEFNKRAHDNLGFTSEEFEKLKIPDFEVVEDAEEVAKHIKKIIKEGADKFETRHRTKDGEIQDIQVSSRAISIRDKNFIQSIWWDITEHKQAEEALHAERDNLTNIMNSMEDGVYIVNQEHDIEYVNPALTKDFGPLEGRKCYEYFNDRNEACPWCKNEDVFAGKTIRWEWYSFKNQKTYDLLDTPLKNLDGSISKLEIFRDITEQKRAQDALRESEEKLRSLFNDALDMIHIVDEDGKIIDANPAELETMAYTRDEYLEKHVSEIFHPDYQTVSKTALNSVLEGKEVRGLETAWITKHGERIDVEVNAVPQTERGKIVSVRVITRDITERKQAEEERKKLEAQFEQAQKMEAIGTLAGGIAHDFNNLLMGVQGNVSLMLIDMDSTHPYYERLKNIEKQVQSGARLTSHLLGYARKGKYEVKPVDLNQLVKESCEAFSRIRKEITIHRELAEDLFAIEADPGQIEQVLLNLYVNAADAMPGGGLLILKTKNTIHMDINGKVYDPKAGTYVCLTVTDAGSGMDKDTMERIFDPFFTTKEMGRGTGLGLASAYGIIKGHGGYIDVDSKKGQGTTFTIYLPASEKKLEKAVEHAEQFIEGTGTVLLVDDEEVILEVSQDLLEAMGYRVLIARDGKEAIEVYRKNQDDIDFVLLDMVMPDMGGGEAYDKMKAINPDVKVLLSSGYSIDGQATEILERGCDSFIQKPFGMRELSGRIREILVKK